MSFPILSLIVFLPLIGGIVTLVLPRQIAWGWAVLVILGDLALSAAVGLQFQSSASGFQFAEAQPWIPTLGLDYRLGVDGVSLFLVILTALLGAVAVLMTRTPLGEGTRARTDLALMLMLVTGMQGVFLSTNVFLFYVFWEIMLVPAYLLIGSFGGPQRARAAITFVIYTAIGSLLMLAGVIGLEAATSGAIGHASLNLQDLANHVPVSAQGVLFLAFFAAFAVKSPLFPFHSWLPGAYVEAPTPVTVLLAGAMSKTGAYGFIRFCLTLFPHATQQAAPIIGVLAAVGILYGAVQALAQTDFKRLLAFSSLSHMGVILLGIFALNPQGLDGGVVQMVNHGITTSALFIVAGLLEQRLGTRDLRALGGLAARVPILAVTFAIAALSSLGLPGLNSFAGEFLALLGAFHANMWLGVIGTLVVIPAAWYLLRFYQGVMQGPPKDATAAVRDVGGLDLVVLVPLVALMIVLGVVPALLADRIEPSITQSIITTLHAVPHSIGIIPHLAGFGK